jgi:hypothetical protein
MLTSKRKAIESLDLLKSYIFQIRYALRLLACAAGTLDKMPPHHVYLLSFMLILERGRSAFLLKREDTPSLFLLESW